TTRSRLELFVAAHAPENRAVLGAAQMSSRISVNGLRTTAIQSRLADVLVPKFCEPTTRRKANNSHRHVVSFPNCTGTDIRAPSQRESRADDVMTWDTK